MTIEETYKLFISTIIDKYGDASVEDFEFTELFNRSALAELKDQFNNTRKRSADGLLPYAFEMAQTDLHKWQSLIQPIDIVTNPSGAVQLSSIEQALGDDKKMFHINTPLCYSEPLGKYVKARYVRHNDYAQIIDNQLLAPTEREPIWRGFDGYIQIDPIGVKRLQLTVTRYPKKVLLDVESPNRNIDSDLSDTAILDVVSRMEQYFAIQIREPQLYQGASEQENKQ